MDAGDFAQPGNDPVQMGDIGDIEHDIDEGVGAFVGACLDVTDVGIFVADHGNNGVYEILAAGGYTTVNALSGFPDYVSNARQRPCPG